MNGSLGPKHPHLLIHHLRPAPLVNHVHHSYERAVWYVGIVRSSHPDPIADPRLLYCKVVAVNFQQHHYQRCSFLWSNGPRGGWLGRKLNSSERSS